MHPSCLYGIHVGGTWYHVNISLRTSGQTTKQKPSALRELLHLPTGNSGIKNQVLSQLNVLRPHGLLHEGEAVRGPVATQAAFAVTLDQWRRIRTGDVSHRRFIGPGSAQGDSDSWNPPWPQGPSTCRLQRSQSPRPVRCPWLLESNSHDEWGSRKKMKEVHGLQVFSCVESGRWPCVKSTTDATLCASIHVTRDHGPWWLQHWWSKPSYGSRPVWRQCVVGTSGWQRETELGAQIWIDILNFHITSVHSCRQRSRFFQPMELLRDHLRKETRSEGSSFRLGLCPFTLGHAHRIGNNFVWHLRVGLCNHVIIRCYCLWTIKGQHIIASFFWDAYESMWPSTREEPDSASTNGVHRRAPGLAIWRCQVDLQWFASPPESCSSFHPSCRASGSFEWPSGIDWSKVPPSWLLFWRPKCTACSRTDPTHQARKGHPWNHPTYLPSDNTLGWNLELSSFWKQLLSTVGVGSTAKTPNQGRQCHVRTWHEGLFHARTGRWTLSSSL